jgi:hypothetical protein
MRILKPMLIGVVLLSAVAAWGQNSRREPHIGYLYPGGGQQGSVFLVTVGGQNLRNPKTVYVSGEGVHAKVARYIGRFRPPNKDQREELERRMKATKARRIAEAEGKPVPPPPPPPEVKAGVNKNKLPAIPNHPLLYNLDDMSLRELAHVKYELQNFRKNQQNAQLAEAVIIEVTVDPGAALGDREMRIGSAAGLTNPMCFRIGTLPETRELEPNGLPPNPKAPKDVPLDLPILVNGQIKPGDVDRFKFRAKQGQQLVVEAQARHLIPYLADAVPGWFQATVALYDAKGKEVAYADDFRFNPDPVLFYKIPADGLYEVEIRDAIYRGRDDFVYRLAIGEQPFITQAFPLGGHVGEKTVASVAGWNLKKSQMPLNTQPGAESIREESLRQGSCPTNSVPYAVDTLPECLESEPNDGPGKAQRIKLPMIVNGRIGKPGDVDVFEFKGRAGDEVVADLMGRRLHSPVDSVLRLMDGSGKVLEWNDDSMHKDGHLHTDSGLLTHHADSYLRAKLPKDGVYRIHMADAQQQGGKAYAYRLSISPPRPDFSLRITPSTINVPIGRAVAVCVYAQRKDGFDGEIDVALVGAPPGFVLDGGRIPSGMDKVRMTLTALSKVPRQTSVLRLEGCAEIGGKQVVRPVAPAEDAMQAFLWRHLAPSQQLMVAVTGGRRNEPPVTLADSEPVRIPANGSVQVLIRVPKNPILPQVRLALNDAPDGVTLHDVTVVPEGLAFTLKADGGKVEAGLTDNLIIDAFAAPPPKKPGTKGPKQKGPTPLGVLPAVAFEVVAER